MTTVDVRLLDARDELDEYKERLVQAQKEQVCIMPGKARLECWGCPIVDCVWNEQPFEDLDVTYEVAMGAAELLRTNRCWIGGAPGRKVYESLGEHPEAELLFLLGKEHRLDFIRNLAVEGVLHDAYPLQRAAALARMEEDKWTSPTGIYAFANKVERARARRDDGVIEEGEQRHTVARSPSS